MERRINLRIPGGNYWCHEKNGTGNSALTNSFRKVHFHFCLPLRLKFEGIVRQMTTLIQVRM